MLPSKVLDTAHTATLPLPASNANTVNGRLYRSETKVIEHGQWWQLAQLIKALVATIFSIGFALLLESVRNLWKQGLTGKEVKLIQVEDIQEPQNKTAEEEETDIQVVDGKIDLSQAKFPIKKAHLEKVLSEVTAIIMTVPDNFQKNEKKIPLPLDEENPFGENIKWIEAFRIVLGACTDPDKNISLEIRNPQISLFSYLSPGEAYDLYENMNKSDVNLTTKLLEELLEDCESDRKEVDNLTLIYQKNFGTIFENMDSPDFCRYLPILCQSEGYVRHVSDIIKRLTVKRIKDYAKAVTEKDIDTLVKFTKIMQWTFQEDRFFKDKIEILLRKILVLKPNDPDLYQELFKWGCLANHLVKELSKQQFDLLYRKINTAAECHLLLTGIAGFSVMERLARVNLVDRNRQNEILNILILDRKENLVRIDICIDRIWAILNNYSSETERSRDCAEILKKLTEADYEEFTKQLMFLFKSHSWHVVKVLLDAFALTSDTQKQALIQNFMFQVTEHEIGTQSEEISRETIENIFQSFWMHATNFNFIGFLPRLKNERYFIVAIEALLRSTLSGEEVSKFLETLVFGVKTRKMGRETQVAVGISKDEIRQVIGKCLPLYANRKQELELILVKFD